MEYKVVKNNSDDFWEDNKDNSFGLGKEITIRFDKNKVSIESQGKDVYLQREEKRAKVSAEGQVIKGVVKNGDKLFLDDEVVIEFREIKYNKINWNLWMGIVVLLLIMTVIFLGWKKTTQLNAENNYQKIMTEVKDDLAKADNIKSMDPETSLKLLNEARKKIQDVKSNKKHENETNDLEKLINEKLATGGSTEIVGFTEIYNTKSADVTDRIYDKMVVSGNEAVLAESKTGKLILVNLELGNVTKFDVGQEIIDLIYANKKIYFYDGRNIFDVAKNKVADAGTTVYSKIINWNNSWYLLGQEGKISKLVDNKISSWTSDTAKLIDKPVSMAIDGTVWVFGQSGEVLNYEKGIEKKWTPSIEINPTTGSGQVILGITTTADSTKIAVISDKKVYVFEKSSGKLLATHNFEKMGIVEAKMGVNELIFVLAKDQKIYKVK